MFPTADCESGANNSGEQQGNDNTGGKKKGPTKTDCSIAFFAAALLSPAILLCGKPLYGANAVMSAQEPFQVS